MAGQQQKKGSVVRHVGVTPPGEVKVAHLLEPEEFQGKTQFKLFMAWDADVAMDWLEQLEPVRAKAEEACRKEDNARNPDARKNKPFAFAPVLKEEWVKEYDEDGNVTSQEKTGRFTYNFVTNANNVVKFYDANGKRIPDDERPEVGKGSRVAVQFFAREWFMNKDGEGVLKMYLDSVQILDLVEGYEGAGGSLFTAQAGSFKQDTFGAQQD